MGWTTMRTVLPALGMVLWAIENANGAATVAARAELKFQQVVLDSSYIAYERDVGDIDGDGQNDVAAVMEGDTTVQVFGAPTWRRSTLITFTGDYRYPRADDFKLADIDSDGDLDVVTRLGKGPSDDGAGIAVWCENLGGGSKFIQHLIGSSLEYVKDIVVVDFDRDGRPDVAMRMDSRTQLWLQESGGKWTEVLLKHPAHEGMEAGDLDGDGDPDLIFNGYWFETPEIPAAARVAANYIYHAIDSAWFNQTGDWTANSCKVVMGDFDGDGRNDVAFSHSERPGHAVAWYSSTKPRVDGTWSKHTVAVVDYCHTLQAADFDLDGDVDLLVGGMIQSQHRGLRLMLNGGGGTSWTESVIQNDGSYSAEIGDIDNDGDPDIVGIRNWNSAPTWIYRNEITQKETKSPQVIASRDSPWGVIKATLGNGPEGDGTILLENSVIRIRYAAKRFGDGNKDHVITDFLIKKTGGQLAVGDQLDGIWMNADEGRGRMTSARIAFDGPDRKILHVEWDDGKVIQEFTIWPDRPIVRIDYIRYGVNIVDMVNSVDTFEVYGAKQWQEARVKAANKTLLNVPNPHHRLTKDLYPKYPFPLLAGKDWEKLEPKELTYHGHLILGAYKRQTGLGFGRVFPVQDANYIKLLNMGFEVFANWYQPHRRFMSYLYAVTGGPDELMTVGKAIADGIGTRADVKLPDESSSLQAAPRIRFDGPLRVHPTNPCYFTDGSGRCILLTGSHTWGSLQDYTYATQPSPPSMDFSAYLAFLRQHNHNFFRLWVWESSFNPDAKQGIIRYDPMSYERSGPSLALDGKPKFDLTLFNHVYFDRLRSRVMAARDNGIYASIMLFNGFSIEGKGNVGGDPWQGHPFNPKNNVNGLDAGSGKAIHTLSNPAVTAYQEAYVRHVIDTVNDLDNVLYEISNEDSGGPDDTAWQIHMIRFIKSYEAGKAKQHPVGMTQQWPEGSEAALLTSPADWISPGTKMFTADGRKVLINDTDHSYFWTALKADGLFAQRVWVWENFTQGNQCLFMDPYLDPSHDPGRNYPAGGRPDPYWDTLRDAMGWTLAYAERMNLAATVPHNELASTGFCLADPNTEYLIYQPKGGEGFSVELSAGTYHYEWFDPARGQIVAGGNVQAANGGEQFRDPFAGDAVLYLKALKGLRQEEQEHE
jgi:hypothetical protein